MNNVLFINNLPVRSTPPILVGGDQFSVTLLVVTLVTCTFIGGDGGAKLKKIRK
jgi:hypothetical protein